MNNIKDLVLFKAMNSKHQALKRENESQVQEEGSENRGRGKRIRNKDKGGDILLIG